MRFKLCLLGCIFSSNLFAQLSIDSCQAMAKRNYPLVRQYELIEKSKEFNLSNASKSYLPQVMFSAKASYQSDVTSIEGMPIVIPKDQYTAQLDVNQVIWDGGRTQSQMNITKATAEAQKQQVESDLYALKDRVNQVFFGLLLQEALINQNNILQTNLDNNMSLVEAFIANGTANESDKTPILVEKLQASQKLIQLKSNKQAYLQMLGVMIAKDLEENTTLVKPRIMLESMESASIERPELLLFEINKKQIASQISLVDAGTMPKLGLFATGAYGEPGLNMFKPGFAPYYVIGARLSWDISRFYTKKNELSNIKINQEKIDIQEELFLYNMHLKMRQEQLQTRAISDQMKLDDEIISLREQITKSAQSKLQNGTLSTIEYMQQIISEDLARQNKQQHEIELLLSIYNYTNTTNNSK